MDYQISVEWKAIGHMIIEADSLQQAVDRACDQEPLPQDWSYLEDSFRIDVEGLREAYQEEPATIPDGCAG